jgi:hypothetical protein
MQLIVLLVATAITTLNLVRSTGDERAEGRL